MATVHPKEIILLVDDTADNILVLGEILQSQYVVRAVTSGQRALENAATPPRPDLILLDVMMPEMDGYECLRRLREDPQTRDIPVIFVTALDSTEDERHGLDLGAVDYITKPVRPAIVRARVRTHLEIKRTRAWLREHNAFLEAEMDRFMEILSHHLQEPVRHQITFTQMLRRYLPSGLNEEAESSLNHILEGATRLRAMLRDVQLYLASHQYPSVDRPCSAKQALDSAIRLVAPKIASTGAVITHGDLPSLWMNPQSLTDVFMALLDNAIDYRHPDRPPRIHVDARTEEGEVILSVTDNGIGIPLEFRDRLFRVFERLHADSGRPGTGIGLALVKRNVEVARGRVWIEDGDDGGTRLCFAIPPP